MRFSFVDTRCEIFWFGFVEFIPGLVFLDNAYDPDVNASQLWIDVKKYNKHPYCLVFTDNGAGMGPEKLHKMLR